MSVPDPDQKCPEGLANLYRTNIDTGLSKAQAAEILKRDGPNELEKPPKPSLLMLFVMQLMGFVITLLVCTAIASVAVNATGPNKSDPLSYTTGMAIFVIVFINAGIAAWTESQAGNAYCVSSGIDRNNSVSDEVSSSQSPLQPSRARVVAVGSGVGPPGYGQGVPCPWLGGPLPGVRRLTTTSSRFEGAIE